MTDAQLHNIFSRFQNLNLVVLIADLERGFAIRGEWVGLGVGRMCPIAHGCNVLEDDRSEEVIAEDSLELPRCEITKFIDWWDMDLQGNSRIFEAAEEADAQLLSVLRSILSERLDDADAVQGVINQLAPPLRRKAQDVSVSETVG